MGFFINDEIKIEKIGGISLSNLYATLRASYRTEKRLNYTDITHTEVKSVQYLATSQLFLQANKDTTKFVHVEPVGIELTKEELGSDILTKLYTEAKSKYENITEDV